MTDASDVATEEPWHGPATRLSTVRRVELVAVALPVVVASVWLLAAFASIPIAAGVGAGVVVATGVADIFVRRRVAAWGYKERQDDLMVRRGVLVRRLSVVPYGRMQFVDVTAGPIERSFGLATIRMHTAAAASDARIPGLVAAEAARIRDQLTALGEARAAGL